jgi:hypothetical protein
MSGAVLLLGAVVAEPEEVALTAVVGAAEVPEEVALTAVVVGPDKGLATAKLLGDPTEPDVRTAPLPGTVVVGCDGGFTALKLLTFVWDEIVPARCEEDKALVGSTKLNTASPAPNTAVPPTATSPRRRFSEAVILFSFLARSSRTQTV